MSQSTAARAETALANLRTLLEVNAQMSRVSPDRRMDSAANEEVQQVLQDVLASAETHHDALVRVIDQWESHLRRGRVPLAATVESRLSPRELVESWVAIKESAADLYRRSASVAPTTALRRELESLAREEEIMAERLRVLL